MGTMHIIELASVVWGPAVRHVHDLEMACALEVSISTDMYVYHEFSRFT
jgi:hypothetical protein